MDNLRYPIGHFDVSQLITDSTKSGWISEIRDMPNRLASAVGGLSNSQLDTPYREGGWTVRQVVHHVPDSHMNAFIRFKLALTEDQPTIKPYYEDRWAKLADYTETPIETSLVLLGALHKRWVGLIENMPDADFARTFNHPESGVMTLAQVVGLYAWHGNHHVAHITSLRERMGW